VGGGTLKKSKKKSKGTTTASWTAVGVAAPSHAEQLAADEAAANEIIASTAADREKAAEAEDEAPEMVDTEGVLRMENGARAGLQTAAQVAADMKIKEDEDKRKAAEAAKEMGGAAQETIYRDASGRVINVAMKRAEARKKAEDEERKKLEKEKAARGDVQNAAAAKRKQMLEDAKTMTVARRCRLERGTQGARPLERPCRWLLTQEKGRQEYHRKTTLPRSFPAQSIRHPPWTSMGRRGQRQWLRDRVVQVA
jgi:pre-mRNA-splicing factor CWC26